MRNKTLLICISFLIMNTAFTQTIKRYQISKDIELIQISEHAFVYVSYSELPGFGRFPSNGLLYTENGKAFLFDTPANDSLTKTLLTWIDDSLKIKIIGFVPNHWHADCMGGLRYLQSKNIISYANNKTIEIAKKGYLPIPMHRFKDSLQLHIDNKTIMCYYLGAAHSIDNIVVWIPSESILFAGCMVKSLESQNLGNTADGDLTAYPQTIEKLIQKFPNAKIVIPGHGNFGGFDLLLHTKELLEKINK